MPETNAQIVVDKLLRKAGWILPGDEGVVNVDTKARNREGYAYYILKDNSDFPLCVIEAKNGLVSLLERKEQVKRYAESLSCRFVIISNSATHYLWDIERDSPDVINVFPTQKLLELRKPKFNPARQEAKGNC